LQQRGTSLTYVVAHTAEALAKRLAEIEQGEQE
jgi:hypothetical protein